MHCTSASSASTTAELWKHCHSIHVRLTHIQLGPALAATFRKPFLNSASVKHMNLKKSTVVVKKKSFWSSLMLTVAVTVSWTHPGWSRTFVESLKIVFFCQTTICYLNIALPNQSWVKDVLPFCVLTCMNYQRVGFAHFKPPKKNRSKSMLFKFDLESHFSKVNTLLLDNSCIFCIQG